MIKLKYQSIANGTLANGFSDFSGNDEIAVAASNSESLSKTATLYTLTFKVLDDAVPGETTVDLKNISFALVNENGEQETVKIADDGVTITIEEEKIETETNTNTNNNMNNETSDEDNKDTNNVNANVDSSSSRLPQTGAEGVSLMAIAVLVVISIVSYVSYRKYKNI